MSQFEDLIKQLDEKLQTFRYTADEKHGIENVSYVSYINDPPPLKVRNLCAVMEPPGDIKELEKLRAYSEKIRKSLLAKYGEAFFWKELEISFVVICDHDLYTRIAEDDGKVISEVSFSLASVMGTCYIDRQNYDHLAKHTFGLFFSGDHFKAINQIVEEYCQKQQSSAA